jgi:hypothetical protein
MQWALSLEQNYTMNSIHQTIETDLSPTLLYRARLGFRQSRSVGDVMNRWVYDIMQCYKLVSLELAATFS